MDDAAAVSDVVDERPELETALEAILEVDDANTEWTFDDVPVDSGVFGELVSRGLVEQADSGDGYRIADPETVRVVLADEPAEGAAADSRDDSQTSGSLLDSGELSERVPEVDTYTIGSLVGGLIAVIVARAYVYGSVFRGGSVVLSGNDPYYYRYWVEQALAVSGGVLDFSGLAADGVQTGEPFLVATLWFFSSLFRGSAAEPAALCSSLSAPGNVT